MNKLNIGTIELPAEAATKTFAILAKRGAGKSYTGAVIAEEFHKIGIPFIVFDPIDVWWGLRLSKDGKGKGLPIVVFGLEHADIPLERDMGRKIAQVIVNENISCVISTFGMPKVAQRELMAELADELLKINNTPRHVFVEEAHEFVPQRVFGAMGKVFSAVEALVVMGRNRGLGVTLINQRAATINKDVLTQIDTLLAFRNIAPQDRKALREWVEAHSAEGDFEEFMKSLPYLPTGEGWIWSPEFLETFEKIKIRERETFHPDREKLGTSFVMPHLEQGDIQNFIDSFKSTSKDETIMSVARPAGLQTIKQEISGEVINLKQQIKDLADEHQKEIDEKDKIIEDLETRLDKILKIAGGNGSVQVADNTVIGGQVEMWASKLPSGSGKILKFLAEKYPMKFTRSQIALANGISIRTFNNNGNYLPTLKRNNMVVEERGEIYINPDLLK